MDRQQKAVKYTRNVTAFVKYIFDFPLKFLFYVCLMVQFDYVAKLLILIYIHAVSDFVGQESNNTRKFVDNKSNLMPVTQL